MKTPDDQQRATVRSMSKGNRIMVRIGMYAIALAVVALLIAGTPLPPL